MAWKVPVFIEIKDLELCSFAVMCLFLLASHVLQKSLFPALKFVASVRDILLMYKFQS